MGKRLQGVSFDTHPNHYFVIEIDDDETVPVKCLEAHFNNRKLEDPHSQFEKIHSHNIKKNKALIELEKHIPDTMKKEVLDEDGDPTGAKVTKNKHTPKFTVDEQGNITLSVPGLSEEIRTDISKKIENIAKLVPHKE